MNLSIVIRSTTGRAWASSRRCSMPRCGCQRDYDTFSSMTARTTAASRSCASCTPPIRATCGCCRSGAPRQVGGTGGGVPKRKAMPWSRSMPISRRSGRDPEALSALEAGSDLVCGWKKHRRVDQQALAVEALQSRRRGFRRGVRFNTGPGHIASGRAAIRVTVSCTASSRCWPPRASHRRDPGNHRPRKFGRSKSAPRAS